MELLRVLWILGCACMPSVQGSRLKTPALPIQPEREPVMSKGLSGCSFGGRFYSLEDTWHPDLGEPFGVMHCVMCHCEPQRSRRGKVFGKVSCRNMKQDCPEPTCDDPVLTPGHCCKTCPKGDTSRKEVESLFEFFQDKDDDLHKSYNDRSYVSSEENSHRDSATDFVSLLTSASDSWLPSSSGVARARFTLSRASLTFSITFQRINRPSAITFLDLDGNTAFEFRVPRADTDMICGVWKNLPKSQIRQLEAEQLRVSMTTADNKKEELRGKIIKHRGLFAETFSAILTSEEVHSGMGGIAMLTLSDTENNLHFILIQQGLVSQGSSSAQMPVRVKLLYRQHVLREIRANISTDDSDLAEVLADLNSRELFWLSRGQLQIAMETEGQNPRQISGYISGKRSCDMNDTTRVTVLCVVQIQVPNSCESGSRGEVVEEEEFHELVFVRDPAELKKDPHTCFFEGEHHAHGSQWTPQYNTCFTCSCQKKTVICDPVICPALSCPHTLQPEDQCCPVCDEKKEIKETTAVEKIEEDPEGCYFEGDQKMHAPGTTWHPFVPPFGYIKCAVCTCKGSTGEVHCEKVTCPPLTCSRPIRANPSDCCKACPAEDTPPLEDDEMMQADGTRHCKFGKNYYQNSEHWHPSVPLVGEMKCITCWCDHGVTKCQRKQCPLLSCRSPVRREGACCPECIEDFMGKEEMAKMVEKKKSWRH
ncbi:chordin [Pimephales promelas]|nr:chordin [Pimephales promelas]